MISRTSISALALVVASAGTAAAFPATATTDLNVRSGPGTGHPVIDTLREGDTVEVTTTSGSWFQLASGGWASGNYLTTSEADTSAYGGSEAYEPGYETAETYPDEFGAPLFYIGADPYFWDDAGYYFYWRDGGRHRVSDDYWRDRDYSGFRWTDARHRVDFERRIGMFEGRASSYDPPRWNDRDEDDRIVPRIFDR